MTGRGKKVFSLVEVEKGVVWCNHFQEQIFDDIAGIWKIKVTRAQRKIEVSMTARWRVHQT